MKNFLLPVLLTLTLVGNAFATGESKVSYFVLNSFKSDFKNATNVTWTTSSDLSRAVFVVDKRKVEAFYDVNGSLVAVSKAIDLDELPVGAKRAFAKNYEGYTVIEAIKYEGTIDDKFEYSYFISAENAKDNVIIRVNQNNQISIFKKQKK